MNTYPDIPAEPAPRRGALWTFLGLALVLLLQVLAALPALEAPGMVLDEGVLLSYPELLHRGAIPQRDYESQYPPGNVWLLAGAYSLFGTSIYVERGVGMLYQTALAAGIFLLLSRWNRVAATVGAALCVLALVPVTLVAFAWLGAVAFAVWSLAAISAGGREEWRGLAAGALAGLALTWRVDLGMALTLALGGYCILAKWRMRHLRWLALGGAVALLPMLGHALVVTPAVFFDRVFVRPVFTTHAGRILPLDFSRAFVGQLYAVLIVSIGAGLFAAWRLHRRATPGHPALVALALLALGALPQAMQRADVIHMSFVTPLALPLLAVVAAVFFPAQRYAPVAVFAVVFALLPQLGAGVRARLAGTAFQPENVFMVHSGSRVFPVGDRAFAKSAQAIIQLLARDSKPGESVFVGPKDLRFAMANDNFLYHLLPWLKPRSYFLEFNPDDANRPGSCLAADIADTDWVILNPVWSSLREPNASQVPGPDAPNEMVRERFDLVFTRAPFELYKRRPQLSQSAAR